MLKLCSVNICGMSARSKHMMENYAHTQNFDLVAIQETGSNNAEKLT